MDNLFPQNTYVLVPISDLIELIKSAVREELKARYKEELDEQMLSPKEVCQLFNPRISLPTLATWTTKGKLQKYSVDGRVWYKRSEVMDALKELKR